MGDGNWHPARIHAHRVSVEFGLNDLIPELFFSLVTRRRHGGHVLFDGGDDKPLSRVTAER
jgi:hypothetical protein